jgi:hypothetical protein
VASRPKIIAIIMMMMMIVIIIHGCKRRTIWLGEPVGGRQEERVMKGESKYIIHVWE